MTKLNFKESKLEDKIIIKPKSYVTDSPHYAHFNINVKLSFFFHFSQKRLN